jgi:outer membrane protein TolC
VSSTTSAARRSKVDAEVELLAARRALGLALHDAEHELDTVRAALPLAREQAALAEQRSRMAQTAFEVGELTMVQVVPALQDARSSQRELLQLQLREQRLISYYNQALGNVP